MTPTTNAAPTASMGTIPSDAPPSDGLMREGLRRDSTFSATKSAAWNRKAEREARDALRGELGTLCEASDMPRSLRSTALQSDWRVIREAIELHVTTETTGSGVKVRVWVRVKFRVSVQERMT